MKKIEDYLHLYIGCDLFAKAIHEKVGVLIGVVGSHAYFKVSGILHYAHISNYLPILRPLSDMTEEDTNEWGAFSKKNGYFGLGGRRQEFEYARWLLSKHFDLFGLIPAGLAIDKTKQL